MTCLRPTLLLTCSLSLAAAATPLQDRRISQTTAYNWAAAGTLGPVLAGTALVAIGGGSDATSNFGISLILLGLGIGPSAGQFYAGSYSHGLAATTLRGLGAVLIVAGASESAVGSCSERSSEGSSCRDRGIPIALAGSLAYFGGVAYSLVDTRFAVRRRRTGTRVSVAPGLGTTSRGDLLPGLHAQVRF